MFMLLINKNDIMLKKNSIFIVYNKKTTRTYKRNGFFCDYLQYGDNSSGWTRIE